MNSFFWRRYFTPHVVKYFYQNNSFKIIYSHTYAVTLRTLLRPISVTWIWRRFSQYCVILITLTYNILFVVTNINIFENETNKMKHIVWNESGSFFFIFLTILHIIVLLSRCQNASLYTAYCIQHNHNELQNEKNT